MKFKYLFLILLITMSANSIYSQSVEEVINKHIEAIGGRKAIKAIKTRRLEIEIVLPDENKINIVNQVKKPHLFHQAQTLPNGIVITRFFNESKGYMSDMNGDLVEMPQDLFISLKPDADIDGALFDFKKKGHLVELIGSETIEGSDAYNIKSTLKNGAVVNYFIDKKSHYITRIIKTAKTPNGDLEIISTLTDYKPVDGVMFAHQQAIKQGSMGILIASVIKVLNNIDIEGSLFEFEKK